MHACIYDVCMCVYVYVCMCVCVYVCRCVCVYVWMCVCVYVCMWVCVYVCMCVGVYVSMCVCVYVCMCVCVYVCMWVCGYVRTYVSTYVSIYLSIYLSVCLSVYLSIYLSMSVCLSVCMYTSKLLNSQRRSDEPATFLLPSPSSHLALWYEREALHPRTANRRGGCTSGCVFMLFSCCWSIQNPPQLELVNCRWVKTSENIYIYMLVAVVLTIWS